MLRIPRLAAVRNRRLALVDAAAIVDYRADGVGRSRGVFGRDGCDVGLARNRRGDDLRKRLLADVESVLSAGWVDVEGAEAVGGVLNL